jgi:hypothetical protein
MKNLFLGILVCAGLVLAGMPAFSADIWPVKIERTDVLAKGKIQVDAGLALESDREIQGLEYNNLRLAPLGARYGLGESAEVGGYIAASDNYDDDDGAPDDSGIEGVSLFGKLGLNQNASLQAGITFLGDDDIAPYPNDGLDLFVNVPLQRQLGKGLLYGQIGYHVKGGDFDNVTYFNYGVGYGLPLNSMLGVNLELVGEEAQSGTNNTLDLVIGCNIAPNSMIRIVPYITLGIYEDSPDAALGGYLYLTF